MNVPCMRASVLSISRRSFFVAYICVASLLIPVTAYAVDCIPDSITLGGQADVDSFQADYNSCTNIVGTLALDTGTFTNLDGLQDIISIGGNLSIEFSRVSSLSGLSNLISIGGFLQIRSQLSPSFSSFVGLSSLTSLGSLMIEDSNIITSLSGMNTLTSLGSIDFFNVRALTNFTGLPSGLNMITEISIISNDSLQSLDGLSPVNGVLALTIRENPNLTSISALAGSVFSGNDGHPMIDDKTPSLEIVSNPKLSSLDGVPAVSPLGAFLLIVIGKNPLITELSVLDGLVEIWGGAGFYDNTALSDCSSLSTVMDAVDDGFPGPTEGTSGPDVFPPDLMNPFGLENNAPGCNTVAEILSSSNEEGVFMDGFETKTTE